MPFLNIVYYSLIPYKLNMHNQGGAISEPASSLKIEC